MDEEPDLKLRSIADIVALTEALEQQATRKRIERADQIGSALQAARETMDALPDNQKDPLALAAMRLLAAVAWAAEENYEATVHSLRAVGFLARMILPHVAEEPPAQP